jgi:uncharacterized protein (DUF433 family)
MSDLIDRIIIDPEICNGKPIIRGMRITVKTIMEYIAAGESFENILKAYPALTKEDISAAIDFTTRLLDKSNYTRAETT